MTHLLTSTFPWRQSTYQLTAKAETAFALQLWWNSAETTKCGISCPGQQHPSLLLANPGWILTSLRCQNTFLGVYRWFSCLSKGNAIQHETFWLSQRLLHELHYWQHQNILHKSGPLCLLSCLWVLFSISSISGEKKLLCLHEAVDLFL